jgi:multiple sugar transport system ATP-binding protein
LANIGLIDIWKKYKEVQALQGLEFETREGELFCLLGPSGAGKTTTLRIISGIETPDKGDVLLNGKSIVASMPRERDIALAFESYALYPQLTVYDNLLFPLKAPIRKNEYTPEQMKKRVEDVAEMLNISDLLNRLPRELSGGQRQRVGLGRVLVRKPQIYLLDEPISHLDAKLRHRMRGELKKIQKDLGITTIYSTPDQLEALSMADTIAVLNKGKIEQIGPPDAIFDRPTNLFVAQFVGDPPMNILESTMDIGTFIVNCDVSFKLAVPTATPKGLENIKPNGKVIIGIRPKDISLSIAENKNAQTQGKVKEVETLGQTSIVVLTIGCLELKAKVATADAPARDSLVNVFLDTSKLHYFSSETQKRLE